MSNFNLNSQDWLESISTLKKSVGCMFIRPMAKLSMEAIYSGHKTNLSPGLHRVYQHFTFAVDVPRSKLGEHIRYSLCRNIWTIGRREKLIGKQLVRITPSTSTVWSHGLAQTPATTLCLIYFLTPPTCLNRTPGRKLGNQKSNTSLAEFSSQRNEWCPRTGKR